MHINANGAVCVKQYRSKRESVKLARKAPGIYVGDLEPGQWVLSVSVDKGVGDGAFQIFYITMPDHDAHMKDLVSETAPEP